MKLVFVVSFFSNAIHVEFRFLLLSLSYDQLKSSMGFLLTHIQCRTADVSTFDVWH